MRETLYGRNAVYESLSARRREFYRLLIADTVRPTDIVADILALAERMGVPVDWVPRRHLDWMGEANHQGVALEASEYPYVDLEDILAESQKRSEPPFLLLLDLLQDPQNVGNLLRTAEAVGVHGVVLQQRRAVGITPAVVHTSAGAVEHLFIAQVPNLPETIERLKARDIWVIGLEAARGARRYDQSDFTGPLALVVGSEGEGLRRLVAERCDWIVELPMMGKISSLNAAVAGSVVLYEAWRQRTVAHK